MRVKFVFLLLCFLGASIAQAQSTPPPILFFTDLVYAHATGNSDPTHGTNQGDYVTLYGNFLDSYTSIKLNGADCLNYKGPVQTWRWYEKVVVQIGSACTTGNFSITTANGTWSGPTVSTTNHVSWPGSQHSLDITIGTKGAIYYVAASGNDNNAGSYSAPWGSVTWAVQTAGTSPGNVVYLMNNFKQYYAPSGGLSYTPPGGKAYTEPAALSNYASSYGWTVRMMSAWTMGTPTMPDSLVAYPGATAQLGCNAASDSSSCMLNIGVSADWPASSAGGTDDKEGWWTFAGITWRGLSFVAGTGGGLVADTGCSSWNGGLGGCTSRNWRYIGNDIASPNASSNTALQTAQDYGDEIYGNYIHDVILGTTSSFDQAVYFSTDSNEMDFGWNEIYNNKGRSGIQVHSSPLCVPSCGQTDESGFYQYGIHIHDNKIHHINGEGIQLSTIIPNTGTLTEVYNNVVWDCGLGGSYSCNAWEYGYEGPQFWQTPTSPPPQWWFNNTFCGGSNCGGASQSAVPWLDSFPGNNKDFGPLTARLANNILISSPEISSTNDNYFSIRDWYQQDCQTTATANSSAVDTLHCPAATANNDIEYGPSQFLPHPNLNTNLSTSNPLVVSLSGADFHLQASSPAISAGLLTIYDQSGTVSVKAPLYDIDGRIRPNPPSIGAYEYDSSIATAPNPPSGLSATVN